MQFVSAREEKTAPGSLGWHCYCFVEDKCRKVCAALPEEDLMGDRDAAATSWRDDTTEATLRLSISSSSSTTQLTKACNAAVCMSRTPAFVAAAVTMILEPLLDLQQLLCVLKSWKRIGCHL